MSGLRGALRSCISACSQAARLMVGQPDYATYLRHFREVHPERTPLSRKAFFDNRMQARYGPGRGGCC
jgi:uncharacterized short protein YbdD (DUF466 family)